MNSTIRRCITSGCTMPSYTVQDSGYCRNCEKKNKYARQAAATTSAPPTTSSSSSSSSKKSEFASTLSQSYKRISSSMPRDMSSSEPRPVRRSPSEKRAQLATSTERNRPPRTILMQEPRVRPSPSRNRPTTQPTNSISNASPINSRSFVKMRSTGTEFDSAHSTIHPPRSTPSQADVNSGGGGGKAPSSMEYNRPLLKLAPRVDQRSKNNTHGSPLGLLKKGISFEEKAGVKCRTAVTTHIQGEGKRETLSYICIHIQSNISPISTTYICFYALHFMLCAHM
jgi:hypothetical protein